MAMMDMIMTSSSNTWQYPRMVLMFIVLMSVLPDLASYKSVMFISCAGVCMSAQARLLWYLHVVSMQHNNNEVIVCFIIF